MAISVKEILNTLKSNEFVLNCQMPLSYVPGLPLLQIKNGNLCLMVPFLRYKVTGQPDKTLVYPIRYTVTFVLPEKQAVDFSDLKYNSRYSKVNFDAPVGLFRHEAVKHMSKQEYKQARTELLAHYDKVIDALLNDAPYTQEDEQAMASLLHTLVEPSLLPIYKALDEDFYNKYLG